MLCSPMLHMLAGAEAGQGLRSNRDGDRTTTPQPMMGTRVGDGLAAMRACALSNTQSATAFPLRPGRVLPRMIPMFNSLMAVPKRMGLLERSCSDSIHDLNIQVNRLDC
jgi:hypothetical protein